MGVGSLGISVEVGVAATGEVGVAGAGVEVGRTGVAVGTAGVGGTNGVPVAIDDPGATVV